MDTQILFEVQLRTWNTDNTGIFDYNNRDIKTVILRDKNNTYYFCRDKNNIIYTFKNHSEIAYGLDILFKLRFSRKKEVYEIINPIKKYKKIGSKNVEKLNNNLWIIFNSSKNNIYNIENDDYYLRENDIIKLGRKKYQVIKLNVISQLNNSQNDNKDIIYYNNAKYGQLFNDILPENKYCNIEIKRSEEDILKAKEEKINENIKNEKTIEVKENNNNNDTTREKSLENSMKNETNTEAENSKDVSILKETTIKGYDNDFDCRICFSKYSSKEDPKLKLCNCNNYVHYSCLKQFLKQNIAITENNKSTIISYYCERFNCEICEKPYPLNFKIKFDGIEEPINYCLIDGLELPEDTNYMILESLTYIKEKKNNKNIYVIKLTGDDVTIGRNDKNDIIDIDISISRYHSILKFDKEAGNVTLENLSKFGTLVLVKDNIRLNENEKIFFQVGRTFIIVEQIKKNEQK